MARVLTVDDSRALRMLVKRNLTGLDVEIDEAVNGEDGLAKLGAGSYDLVLLDVTMPVLDGPGMLAKMRESGNKTPVLMLTSESAKTIVADVMRHGISDYILKPFKPEDIKTKVVKVLGPGIVKSDGAAAEASVDMLIVDVADADTNRLQARLAERGVVKLAAGDKEARAAAKEARVDVFFVSDRLAGVDAAALQAQLKSLRPQATFVQLLARPADGNDPKPAPGFDAVFTRPYVFQKLDAVVTRVLDAAVRREGEVLHVRAYSGAADQGERYLRRLGLNVERKMLEMASAQMKSAKLVLADGGQATELASRVVAAAKQSAERNGLSLKVVAGADAKKEIENHKDSAGVPVFESLEALAA